MHVWQWLLTGLAAGLIARYTIRGPRIGLAGDLALGALGGIASGALFRLGGITESGLSFVHVAAAMIGAVGALATIHLFLRATLKSARAVGAAFGGQAADREVRVDGALEQRIWRKFVQHKPVAQDPNALAGATTVGQRAADRIAAFGGSWAFLGLFFAAMATWMLYNLERPQPFDPYPFILLNLMLSCVAAVQAPIIMMSQNRQSEKDRLHARLDYEVNLKAELEIMALHEKLDLLREQSWKELLGMQQHQLELLARIERSMARDLDRPDSA